MSDRVRRDDGSGRILDAAYAVYNELGPGMLETVYERALMMELAARGIKAQNQVPIRAFYKGKDMGIDFRIDILVEDSIILELKSVEQLNPVHEKQLLTYLKLANKQLGLLININESYFKRGIKRVVNGFEESPVESKI